MEADRLGTCLSGHRAAVSVNVYIFWSQALWWEEEEKENNTWSKRRKRRKGVHVKTTHSLISPKQLLKAFILSKWLRKGWPERFSCQTYSSTKIFFQADIWKRGSVKRSWNRLLHPSMQVRPSHPVGKQEVPGMSTIYIPVRNMTYSSE